MYKTIWSSLSKEFFVFEVCFIMRCDHPKPVSSWDTIGLFRLWFSSFSVLESDNQSFLNLCFFFFAWLWIVCMIVCFSQLSFSFLCFVFMCVQRDVDVHVCTGRCRKSEGKHWGYHSAIFWLTPLRQVLSLVLEIGWQSASPSNSLVLVSIVLRSQVLVDMCGHA